MTSFRAAVKHFTSSYSCRQNTSRKKSTFSLQKSRKDEPFPVPGRAGFPNPDDDNEMSEVEKSTPIHYSYSIEYLTTAALTICTCSGNEIVWDIAVGRPLNLLTNFSFYIWLGQ